MKKIAFLLTAALLTSNAFAKTEQNEFNLNYFEFAKILTFHYGVVDLTDSLGIMYLHASLSFENNGDLYIILTPKDTSISKIYNDEQFGVKDWKRKNEFKRSQIQAMTNVAVNEFVESKFNVYIFYIREEYMYENGSAVDDEGIVHPDYSVRDDAPIEIYKLKDGKWLFEEYIPNRNGSTNQQYGIDKAKEILKERFGKMAEEMEKNKYHKE